MLGGVCRGRRPRAGSEWRPTPRTWLALIVLSLATACGGGASTATPHQRPATPTPFRLPAGAVAPLDATTCPPGYPIKGYRNKHGVPLYRTPPTRDYAKVTPEACFATESDARGAGYRRADAT